MTQERKPLLTEEQIQEMLKHTNGIDKECYKWLHDNRAYVFVKVMGANCDPTVVGMDLFLAFLRGKTKRVLNIDRLRADVKAWVDDPNRKWPEYLVSLIDFDHRQDLASDSSDLMDDQIQLCMFAASIIGINPDDYFEEVEVEDGVQH